MLGTTEKSSPSVCSPDPLPCRWHRHHSPVCNCSVGGSRCLVTDLRPRLEACALLPEPVGNAALLGLPVWRSVEQCSTRDCLDTASSAFPDTLSLLTAFRLKRNPWAEVGMAVRETGVWTESPRKLCTVVSEVSLH